MILKNKISDSAYLVNISRNKSLSLNHDIYSNLWIPENQKTEVRELWNKYSYLVYPHDDIELGIRTLYFLNILKYVIKNDPNTVFINIGSGFTSYQYLLDRNMVTIEIDYSEIVNAKRRRAKILEKNDILPHRTTHYIPCNLNDTRNRIKAFKKIKYLIGNNNCLVLCEGLFYYLSLITVEMLIKNISILQKKGNLLIFDYWKPNLNSSKIYRNMIEFYKTEMSIDEKDINLFEASDIIDTDCFQIIEMTNVFEQEKVLLKESVLLKNKEYCLEENYIKLMNIHPCNDKWL